MSEFLLALLSGVTIRIVVPLVILALICVFIWWLLVKASRSKDFQVATILLDENNKVSSSRLLAFLAFGVTSWYLAVEVINGASNWETYLIYSGSWSSSLILKDAVGRWDGRLPFAKGGE